MADSFFIVESGEVKITMKRKVKHLSTLKFLILAREIIDFLKNDGRLKCNSFQSPSQGKSEVEENGAVEIARCFRGQYFGELALVTNKPRAASAHAIGTVKCLGRVSGGPVMSAFQAPGAAFRSVRA